MNFQGNICRSSFVVKHFSALFIAKILNVTKRYSRFHKRFHSSRQGHKYISCYYNKGINWGDTSDFIANAELFLSEINFWKAASRITFKYLRSFQGTEAAVPRCFQNRHSWKCRSIHRKIHVLVSFLIKLQALRAATLLNRDSKHKCFPLNIAKLLRIPFSTEHLRWTLL